MLLSLFDRDDIAQVRTYRDGQVVLPQGDTHQAFGVVIKGRLEVYHKTEDGEDLVYKILEAQDTFGIHSLFDSNPRPSGIRALGRARVVLMDRIGFLRNVHEHPQMAFQVLKGVSVRLKQILEELKQKKSEGEM